jgi:tRNA threonylcarbamoyladenosine biosynthesis protein TsaB
VCLGPGSYAGLRVGISTAKALAYALGSSLVGVGRLAADALPLAVEPERRVVAVHAAGRAELAWAAYSAWAGDLKELAPPSLTPKSELAGKLAKGDLICGELDDETEASLRAAGLTLARPAASRVVAVSRLAWARYSKGEFDSADELVPLYLREPAIGPQNPIPR